MQTDEDFEQDDDLETGRLDEEEGGESGDEAQAAAAEGGDNEGDSAKPKDGEDAEEAEKRTPKRSFQRRINKVTREKHEALREADKLRKENAELKKQQHSAQAEQSRPKQEDFEDYASYEKALETWARETATPTEPTSDDHEVNVDDVELADTMDNIVTQAEQEDFQDVVFNPKLDLTFPMVRAAAESDMAADLLYYLGQNPEEATRISQLPESSIPREIGRLEARIESGAPAPTPKPTGKTPPSTPEPATPVKTGTEGGETGLSDKLPIDEWMKRRKAQVANST